ncbi:recombinase family protein [Fundicoccus culcitae]|uniref:Recombinase family protein n=1 Tax=Fundicoccus culcitae TaxID=2969821 RepID=A0ABY5P7Y4_9LACT|nr:recombinase family protein [Fundicoccus culcitae]UUX34836.1 recombinase family protein [Fundicoccus culcitae]
MDSKIWYIPARNDRLDKNVGIYCRVSTNEKEQLYSLAAQISALTRAVANVSQWRLADVFIDIASAKGDAPRREFERLIKECEAHNISVVLTKSISKFGRDTVETLSALNRLTAAGARIIFEEENLDTDEVDSNLMISVMESFAQAENESRSENIRMGLAMRAANGTSGLYKRKLYGYKKNKDGELIIDDEQAKVVRDVFRWYLDGASVLGIIKKLSDTGIRSPAGKEKWSKRSIEKMLENEKYTGTVTLLDSATQKYEFQMKECHLPIITESEFRAVQKEKKKRSNVIMDDDGTRRSSKKYSSKRK